MRKITTCALATIGLAMTANAANVALGSTYSYSELPRFSGGTHYFDDSGSVNHDGYTTAGAFDNGDLNDGVIFTTGNPVFVGSPIVAWDPTPKAAVITFDLGAAYDITEVKLDSFVRTDFALGAPDDYELSFSSDNITYGAASTVTTNFTFVTGGKSHTETVSAQARYVRLSFDGDSNGGDKWGLTEVSIEGTIPAPEPSSAALLGLGGLALILRRRK